MKLDYWIEAVKMVGSIAGLVTFVFVAFDRLLRDHPVVFLTSSKNGLLVGVNNISDEDMLVQAIDVHPKNVLNAAKENELRDTILGSANMPFMSIIPAKKKAEFPLLMLEDYDILPNSTMIRVVVTWRIAAPRYFMWVA